MAKPSTSMSWMMKKSDGTATALCSRRGATRRSMAFVDSPRPLDLMEPSPSSLMPSVPVATLSAMVLHSVPSDTRFSLAPATHSLPAIIARMDDQLQDDVVPQHNQPLALDFKDKMGLFLSICSVLVSIQLYLPRAL